VNEKAIILGNGESRKGIDYRKVYPDHFVYGCNGAYKESPDALVCTDSYMQHIIYETNYCEKNLCYFSEWDPLPGDVALGIAPTAFGDLAMISNNRENRQNAQIAGTEKFIYITWVDDNDNVISIPEIEISSGSRALLLACEAGFKEILLLGFDGMGATNVYQKDKGYERSTPRAEWISEREKIKGKFKDIKIKEV